MTGGQTEFAVPFGSDRFVSSDEVIAFKEDPFAAVFRITTVHNGHARLALALDSVRLFPDDTSVDQADDESDSKLWYA